MTSMLARRTAVVAATAAVAFSGIALAGSAVTANAAAKAHTSLSIRIGRAAINPGGSDTVSGQLRSWKGGVAGHWIELLDKPKGTTTWSKLAAHRAGRHGFISFEVTPSVTTRYVLAFAGNKRERASRSAVGTVRVL
ncbi:MAG TPA: hypothetical protein VME70_00615, partial [Mycobacteriales bacterium]|nr:hypothetical protein [Mycobacteriales bacterium]